MVDALKISNFAEEVTNSEVPVLVKFGAPWCGPCKTLDPVLEQVATDFEGRAKVLKVNIDEEPELAKKFSIRGLPTVMLFDKGDFNLMTPARSKQGLTDLLNEYV